MQSQSPHFEVLSCPKQRRTQIKSEHFKNPLQYILNTFQIYFSDKKGKNISGCSSIIVCCCMLSFTLQMKKMGSAKLKSNLTYFETVTDLLKNSVNYEQS